MFPNILIGGQRLLDELDKDSNEERQKFRLIHIAQDLMYTANGDKFLTPKHIGIASTLHQATRSKELVNMFHQAGHSIKTSEKSLHLWPWPQVWCVTPVIYKIL